MTYKFYSIFNSEQKDDKDNEAKHINYFKWKILGIIDLVLSQIDSDTAKITAARGIAGRCLNIINGLSKNEELIEFSRQISSRCGLSYGNNDAKLQEYVSRERAKVNEDLAWQVEETKLSHGDYYDYKFLHTAVEMVLLEEEARGNTRIREFTSTMLTRLDFFLNNWLDWLRFFNNDLTIRNWFFNFWCEVNHLKWRYFGSLSNSGYKP